MSEVVFVFIGLLLGAVICRCYLWHIAHTLTFGTHIQKYALCRPLVLMLIFGSMCLYALPMGISGLVSFIITRNIILFKHTRRAHGTI